MNLPTYLTGTIQSKAYRVLREHVNESLNQYDLTPTYWSMMGMIHEAPNGIRLVQIARALHVKPPLITTIAQELEARGLIKSVVNQFDARSKLLVVTHAGKKFMQTVEATLTERIGHLLDGIKESELITYHKVLTAIIDNSDKLK